MSSGSESELTLTYYDRNAEAVCNETDGLDMSRVYEPFLAHIPRGGLILDAGCGCGRDSAAFLRQGYKVVSIDGSAAMVAATIARTKRKALLMRFGEMDFDPRFDGIWACASLLHIPQRLIKDTFDRFERALKPGGIWFMNFKAGHGERWEHGRFFCDYTERTLSGLLATRAGLDVLRLWTAADARSGRAHERWTNGIVRRRVLIGSRMWAA